MAFAAELIDRLKSELKRNNVTYSEVAACLDLSESSIKRLFSERDMSLSRLESICQLVQLDISELARKADDSRRQLRELTLAQEEELVGNEKLLLIAVHLIYGWSYQQILDAYELDEFEAQRCLTTLDRFNIIQLLADNRVKILLSPDFEWIQGGPIQAFFENSIQDKFFESSFSGSGELRLVVNGWMSLHTIKAFHENMRRLAKEFELQKQYDQHVPVEKCHGTSLVLAIRPWTLEIFEKYNRH